VRGFWITASLVAIVAAALPAPAAAQDLDAARHHYEAGRSYYEQLRYADAAREFEEAYRLSSRPHLLKNVAVSHQHAQAWADAIEAFELYLEEVPDAEDRGEIEERIARLRELAAEGAEEDPQLEEADADRDLVAEEAPTATTSTTTDGATDEDGGGFPTASVITMTVGVALGVGALITGLIAHGVYEDLQADCPSDACDPAREADKDRGQSMAITSTVLTATAGAAAIAAVILFFTVDQADGEAEEATARLTPGPGDVGAGVALRF
jgi:tetratricopeptide (TPR) repeat protein